MLCTQIHLMETREGVCVLMSERASERLNGNLILASLICVSLPILLMAAISTKSHFQLIIVQQQQQQQIMSQ